MGVDTEKIWKAVTNLDKADIQTAALCHAIIAVMIDNGIVTKKEATRQIEKSILKVVTVHKQIANAMYDQNSALGARAGLNSLQ